MGAGLEGTAAPAVRLLPSDISRGAGPAERNGLTCLLTPGLQAGGSDKEPVTLASQMRLSPGAVNDVNEGTMSIPLYLWSPLSQKVFVCVRVRVSS